MGDSLFVIVYCDQFKSCVGRGKTRFHVGKVLLSSKFVGTG